eukprot:COSAG06_NODE_58174_length_278_cov_0.553073_1_plen_56_part_01
MPPKPSGGKKSSSEVGTAAERESLLGSDVENPAGGSEERRRATADSSKALYKAVAS